MTMRIPLGAIPPFSLLDDLDLICRPTPRWTVDCHDCSRCGKTHSNTAVCIGVIDLNTHENLVRRN